MASAWGPKAPTKGRRRQNLETPPAQRQCGMCRKVRARLRKRGPGVGRPHTREDGSGADPEQSGVSRTKAHRRPGAGAARLELQARSSRPKGRAPL